MAPTSTSIPAKSFPNFTPEERQAMLEEAHRRGLKVAIHCTNAWDNFLCKPGYFRVDSLEHGMNLLLGAKDEREEWTRMRSLELSHVPWTPALSIVWKQHLQNPQENGPWDQASRAFKKALEMGLDNITTGGDTGPSPHGENALELILMRRLGAPWSKVLRWATFGGWQCLKRMGWDEDNLVGKGIEEVGENDMAFGVIQPGWAADIIGFQGIVDGEVEEFEKAVKSVEFVMKNGRIWKENGLFVESV
jgi:imidazolonepropionase-like amidohydrolase